jgi:NADH-quinone oxidoreductase subunit K
MFQKQLIINFILLIFGLIGISFNRRNFLITLMCIELILLSININFLIFSVYLDDFYGQIFALFILMIAASESAIGIALIIAYYKFRNNILIDQKVVLRY